ncbi:MAG: hypothetical protein RL885_09790 [Planctomycetota bacterium]
MSRSVLLSLAVLLTAGLSARADHTNLEIHHIEGGTLGGKFMVHMHGEPGHDYAFIPSFTQGPVTVQGFTLNVDLNLFLLFAGIPGMTGTIPAGTGDLHVHFPLPSTPALDGVKIHMQAILFDHTPGKIGQVSNAASTTLGANDTVRSTGAMGNARSLAAVSVLGHKWAHVTGGGNGSLLSPAASATAEYWDPRSESFSASSGDMTSARALHTSTGLSGDKDALIVGGVDGGQTPLASAEILTGEDRVFAATGSLLVARYGHAAVRLQDGRILVIGGASAFGSTLAQIASAAENSTEIYDPNTGTFSAGPNLAEPRFLPTATLLADGRVLVTGGLSNSGGTPALSATAEIFDPNTGTFGVTIAFGAARFAHQAVLLASGDVLIAGGWASGATSPSSTGACELFDSNTDTFASTGSLNADRAFFGAVRLPMSGKVLVLGGGQGGVTGASPTATIELFDPNTGLWTTSAGQLSAGRLYAVTSDQGHGKVLVSGGDAGTGAIATADTYYGK